MTATCPHCHNPLDAVTATLPPSKPPEEAVTLSVAAPSNDHGTLLTAALPPMPQSPFGGALGDYELLNELGAGGMGTVYRARQRSADRIVAVKVIRADVLAGMPSTGRQEWVHRFQAEARATARLEHDHIVTVYDVRECAGHHFYSMRYVEGRSLAEIVREGPVASQRAAAYLEPVARAVHHAHTHGLLHRDLKPSNILVDRQDRPFVTDFGLVKLVQGDADGTAPAGLTQTGHIIGTPEYMSPEQASNSTQVTVASDVYSLGATLYDLLTGRPPFRAATPLDTLLQVIEQEPVPPRQLNPAIDRDLETITLKCLQKEPSRRYRSAEALADDLRRYREGAPIQARPVSRVEKAWRWCRRKPLAASLLAALLLVLVGATTVSTTLGLWAWSEKVRADDNADREGLARQEAESNAKEAAEREVATQVVLDFVENKILAAAGPAGQQGGLGHDVSLRQAIETALPFVETSFKEQPIIEARLRMTLGATYGVLGEYQKAAQQYEKARTLYTQQLGAESPATLRSIVGVAQSYGDLGRRRESLALFDQTLAIQKVKLGHDHPDTLFTMHQLAASYDRLGRLADAVKLHQETLALREATLGSDHPDTLVSRRGLSKSLGRSSRFPEALELEEKTLALSKTKLGENHPDTLQSMGTLAYIYFGMGKQGDGLKLMEETLKRRRAALGEDHPDTLGAMNASAFMLHGMKRYEDALQLREQILPLAKRKLGVDHPHTLQSMHVLVDSYFALGRPTEALKLQNEAVELARNRLGADHAETLWGMHLLANSHEKLGQNADALRIRQQLLTLATEKYGPNHSDTFSAVKAVAVSLMRLFRNPEALKLLEDALPRQRAALGADHADTLWTMLAVGELRLMLNRGPEAIPIIDEWAQRATTSNNVDLSLVQNLMVRRTGYFKSKKDVAGCRTTTELWEKLIVAGKDKVSNPAIKAVSFYNAACFRGNLATMIKEESEAKTSASDAKTPGAKATRLAAEEADRAMVWLKQAVAAGFKDVKHMKADKDLDALRDREDFKKLLQELEAKPKEDGKK